jgi:hypothetical protein
VLSYVDRKIVGWFSSKLDAKKKAAAEAQLTEKLELRFSSLNAGEFGIVIMCLRRGTQSFSAKLGHTAAESLCNKGVLSRGSGTVFDVNYHFTDEAWRYLLAHESDYLGKLNENDVRSVVRQTEERLHDHF